MTKNEMKKEVTYLNMLCCSPKGSPDINSAGPVLLVPVQHGVIYHVVLTKRNLAAAEGAGCLLDFVFLLTLLDH